MQKSKDWGLIQHLNKEIDDLLEPQEPIPALEAKQQQQLDELLDEYQDVIAKEGEFLGCTNRETHAIITEMCHLSSNDHTKFLQLKMTLWKRKLKGYWSRTS